MNINQFRSLIKEAVEEVNRPRKYTDVPSRRLAKRLLDILSPYTMTSRDYKFDNRDDKHYIYLFYVTILKQDGNIKDDTLKRLTSFSERFRASIRIFIDMGKICIEVKVPKAQQLTY